MKNPASLINIQKDKGTYLELGRKLPKPKELQTVFVNFRDGMQHPSQH